MITSLRLQNFKSWADTGDMRLAPITGLFGTNSSGKTSILQLLLLLKQTAESTDRAQVLNLGDERGLVDLGTFRDIVHGHEPRNGLEWSLSWSLPKPIRITDPELTSIGPFSAHHLGFDARVIDMGGGTAPHLAVDQFEYCLHQPGRKVGLPCFGMRRMNASANIYDLTERGFFYRRFRGGPSPLPPPVKCYGFPDQVYATFRNVSFLAGLQLELENLCSGMYYLGPLREDPRRQYAWAGTQPSDVGRRGERAIDALLAAEARQELIRRGAGRKRRPLHWVVAEWLKRLGLIYSFSVETIGAGGSLYQVHVQKSPESAKVLLTDVGFGVSQILPVLILCYYVPEGSTVILEHPEMHLHPAVQAGLADVLIDVTETRGIQIILESHSEHLLRRLQRRIAEEQLAAADIALYFCDFQHGASRLTPLQLDEFGNIANWPDGFFGDELGDLVAMTNAAMKRQLATAGS